jgi:hypothetical protein
MHNDSDRPAFDGALHLADWGVIRVNGIDARSFLQGQLTQDMAAVSSRQARLAGYCSAKGRLLATFIVWQPTEDEFLLACSADLLPGTLKRLSMFVLRAKCKLSDASDDVALWGVAGRAAIQSIGNGVPTLPWQGMTVEGGHLVRLPDADGVPRLLWSAAAPSPAPALPKLDANAWQWLEVRSGVVRIVAANVEQFVPQMVNLELLAGVSFSKGCYPGQEVVARSQYRGTLKRRTYLVDCSAPLAPGQEVFHSDDAQQPAGKVVLAASLSPTRHAALVELKIAALDHGTLRCGDAELHVVEQPYALDTEVV